MQALCKVLETLVKDSRECTLAVNSNGLIVTASNTMAALFGTSRDSLLQRHIEHVLPGYLDSAQSSQAAGYSEKGRFLPLPNNIPGLAAQRVQAFFSATNVGGEEITLALLKPVKNTTGARYPGGKKNLDELTGLPNKTGAVYWLEQSIATIGESAVLLYVDLDDFKRFNNALGRATGDELIRLIAHRLQRLVSIAVTDGTGHISRIDSDEFLIVLSPHPSATHIKALADSVIATIQEPLSAGGETLYLNASIGVSRCNANSDPQRLIEQAEVAMQRAKQPFNTQCHHYSADFARHDKERLTMECCLHDAVDQTEFIAFYQPQLSVADGQFVGSEALLRWNSKILGSVSPSVFVPLLETQGLIVTAGHWILAQACHAQAVWITTSRNSTISVNLSSQQLHHKQFVSELKNLLHESRLPPENLVLELTESILFDEAIDESRVLHRIKDLGIKLALDDFGTGYGTLSHLKNQPIDQIKIDRSFITHLMHSKANRAITTSVIDLAYKLGKTVTAEGVDSSEVLQFLRNRGCHHYQGYLGSVPLPADQLGQKFIVPPLRRTQDEAQLEY